jgi:hypothetical protein
MDALANIASRAAEWSASADRLKSGLVTARWSVFILLVIGVVTTSTAGQLANADTERSAAVIGAVALALSAFLAARLQSAQRMTAWTRARAAAEALKRQAFVFAAGAAPYDDPATAEALLNQERDRIERDADDLLMYLKPTRRPGSAPRAMLSQAEYRQQRIQAQAKAYYRPAAERYGRIADRLRMAEFVLALAAALVAAVCGALQVGIEIGSFRYEPIMLTPLLTTVTSAILAHIEACRYQFVTITYRAAARRLESENALTPPERVASPAEWSAFVARCEDIIAAENMSWTAKWTDTWDWQQPSYGQPSYGQPSYNPSWQPSPSPTPMIPAAADSDAIAARKLE